MLYRKILFFILIVVAAQSESLVFGDLKVDVKNSTSQSQPETSYYFPSNTQQVRESAAHASGYGIQSALKELYGSQEYLVWRMQQAWSRQQEELCVEQEKKRIEQETKDRLIADHQSKFGIDQESLKKLYKNNFDYVEKWIKKTTCLSKDQALSVWEGYCDKRCWRYDQKADGKKRITKEYNRREKVNRQRDHAELEKTLAKMDRVAPLDSCKEFGNALLELEGEKPCSSHLIQDCIHVSRDTESLQGEYEKVPLFYDQNISVACGQRLQVRQQALDQTKQEPYAQYKKTYQLSDATQGYLRSQDILPIDFQQCFGTTLQHVMHGEICEIFESVADISKQLPYQSSMLTQATLCADIAYDANCAELMSLTCLSCDVSHGIAGFVLGVGRQMNRLLLVAGEQAVVFAAHALNPIEIAHGLQAIISCVCDGSGYTQEDMQYVEQNLTNQDYLQSKVEQRIEQVACGVCCLSTALQSWHHDRSMQQKSQDIVKGITDVGVSFVVPDVIIGKVVKVLGLMSANVRAIRTLEGAASILEEELSFAAALESGVLLEKDAELLAQFKVGEELIAAKQEQYFSPKMPWMVEEVRSSDGKIIEKMRAIKAPNSRVTDITLIENAKKMAQQCFVVSEETLQKVKAFAQANKSFEMEFLGKIERFEVDWEHILLPMVKEREHFNNVTKMYELKGFDVVGWHHGLWQEFEKQGLIRIVDKAEKNGCARLDFMWGYNKKSEFKTFYPDVWNYENIYDAIKEALVNNFKIIEKNISSNELSKTVFGRTHSGIEIEMKLTKKCLDDRWKIATAFVSKEFFK